MRKVSARMRHACKGSEGRGATKVVIFCSLSLSCSRCLSDHERPIFTNLGGDATSERANELRQFRSGRLARR